MTDQEMLELAIQGMDFPNYRYVNDELGFLIDWGHNPGSIVSYWNPLRSMSQALGMAIHMKIDIDNRQDYARASTNTVTHSEDLGSEPNLATCRAIVWVAAEIQRRKL